MNAIRQVLVIDDDVSVRLRLGDILGGTGSYAFHEAADGPSGIAAATALQPDLILLDIMMPGMTGYEVCTTLRADPRTREIPVIVLSAAEESEAMIAAIEAGADDFLRKPFHTPELRAKVRTITRLDRFRALAAERDRFRWLLDRSLEPLIVADPAGALVYANQSARNAFELDRHEGVDVAAAIGRHFHAEPADAWTTWRKRRTGAGGRFTIVRPESELTAARWFEVELHGLEAPGNQTLLKFTNRSHEVQREIETFTVQHFIAHKIRTPLNGIAPILEFLAVSEDAKFDEDTTSLLQLARASTERLEQTLTAVLDYHAALSGRSPARTKNAKQLAAVAALAADATGLAGRVNLLAPTGTVAHAETLEIVLTELLENYVKFSTAGTDGVTLRLVAAPDHWLLQVYAPGPRLPADVVAQLGRPLAQLEKKFTGEVPGMGLGLATVRLLLRSIGGNLTLANHPEAPGIVTTVQLPIAAFIPSPSHVGETQVA